MRDSLDTVFEMSKLVKYSPRRDTILEQLKREMDQIRQDSVCFAQLGGPWELSAWTVF